MDVIRRPEDLIAWQLCMELDQLSARLVSEGRAARDLDFSDQLRRSAGAAAPLIAEGFGRYTPKDFANYLRMAVGSLMETQTHLARGLARGYFTQHVHSDAATLCGRALRMTRALLKSKLEQIARDDAARKARRRPR